MAKEKPDLFDWLGLRRAPGFSRARWLGGLVSVAVIGLLAVFLLGAIVSFVLAVIGGDPDGVALRNTGLVLAAMIGLPFLVWRSVVARKQVDVAEQKLFNDKINAAADDLHARRLVSVSGDEHGSSRDIWQDDIIKRNAAIDRLKELAKERPDAVARITRMLCLYVREPSPENEPQPVPEDVSPEGLRQGVWSPPPRRPDMQNAAQALDRLRAMGELDPAEEPIDLHGANLQGFELRAVSWNGARLSGVRMQGANLIGAKMQGASLIGAQMQGTNLVGADLGGADLRGARMQGVNLSEAGMQGASLLGARMQGAILMGTRMQGAIISGADLRGAILGGTKVNAATSFAAVNASGAAVREVDFSDVALDQAQVDGMFGDGSVSLPAGLTRPDSWPQEDLNWSDFEARWCAWRKERGFEVG